MKFSCIIQSRTGSNRLPKKAILKIFKNQTLLDFCLSQLKYSKNLDQIILATTQLPEDDILIKIAQTNGINFFRGSENDVLSRYYYCAKKFSIENIIRITADNPLIDPNLIDDVMEKFESKNYDYVTNCFERTFPYGTEVEIFSFNALEKAWNLAKKKSEREHVTPFFYNNPNLFNIFSMKNSTDLSFLRYTVDRKNDFELVKKIIKNISNRPILMEHIQKLYLLSPKIFLENSMNLPNEGYLKSLESD